MQCLQMFQWHLLVFLLLALRLSRPRGAAAFPVATSAFPTDILDALSPPDLTASSHQLSRRLKRNKQWHQFGQDNSEI